MATTLADATSCGGTLTTGVTDTVNHYAGGVDSPAWTVSRVGGVAPTSSTTWYVSGLVGGLLATVSGSTVTVGLADLHGDIPISASTTQAVAPDGTTTDTDEYGVVHDTTGTMAVGPRYAWLGTAQRDATATNGLTLMGVRIYNPVSGRFLSTDPVYGGNATTYGYPSAPASLSDTSGRSWGDDFYCEAIGKLSCMTSLSSMIDDWSYRAYPSNTGGLAGFNYWDDINNAARHFVWNLVLVRRVGQTLTTAFVMSHEIGIGYNKADSIRDRHNNFFAWRFFSWAKQNLQGGWGAADIMADVYRARNLFTHLWYSSARVYFFCTKNGQAFSCPAY
jgi:RHS repeat-associated protein